MKIRKRRTFLNMFSQKNKKILFFGSYHSWNPEDPEMDQIKKIFKKFNPTLVLVETTKLISPKDEKKAILQHGETGLVQYLAQKNQIKAIPADPNKKLVIKKLAKKYSKDELVLYFLLRTLDQYPKVKIKPKFNDFLKYVIKEYKKIFGHLSYQRFQRIFKKVLKKKFNPNSLGKLTELFNPEKNLTILNLIARDESFLRDSYTLSILKKMLKKFDRILIVKGIGHAKFFEENIPKILKQNDRAF